MKTKNSVLSAVIMVFMILSSSLSFAATSTFASGSFDVSIDRVVMNGSSLASSKTNLVNDADQFSLSVDITAVRNLTGGHVEATLRGKQSGDSVSDSSETFDLEAGDSVQSDLNLILVDKLKRETQFDLTVKVVDVRGRSETKTYGVRTESSSSGSRSGLDVSIDRVFVNDAVVAPSRTNFIDETNDFSIVVEFTALENLENAHVEAVLRDLNSGTVVADASPLFNLNEDQSAFEPLSFSLIDQLKRSGSFELTIKIIDSEGEFIQQAYGIKTKESGSGGSGNGMLDISVDRIEVEDDTIVENENNYLVIGDNKKELDVDVFLTSLEDIEDARVEAILTLENGDVVSDVSNIFDISDEATVRKSLELPFIGSFLQSDFKLKIKIIDAEGDFEEKVYGIKLTKQKLPFVINTVTLGSESIASGRTLDVKVNYKNIGTSTVEFANLVISIPELGVIASKPIGSSSPGFDGETEFSIKIPSESEAGIYTVSAEIESRNAVESESLETELTVTEPFSFGVQNDKLLITVPVSGQDIANDGTEAVYPLTFKNAGTEAKTYSLKFDSKNVNLRLSDSSIFVLNAGESKTINLYVSYKGDEFAGDQKITVTVESNGEVLKQIPLRATIAGEIESNGTFIGVGFRTVLMISLIVLVIVLAMLGLYFGIKMTDRKDDETSEMQSVEYASEIPDASPEGELYY